MFRLLNFWATIYRNTRALSVAIVMWAAVALMWGLKCQSDRDPMLGMIQETGTVIEHLGNEPAPGTQTGLKLRQSVIMLADSTLIDLVLQTPLPAVGDRIPLRVEEYRSGKKVYTFDLQQWQISGPR